MLTVRPAIPAEYPAIGELTVSAYRADGQLTGDNPYESQLRDVAGRAERNQVLVAVDDAGRVSGAVTYVLPGSDMVELSGPGEAEFRMLAVDPAAQGRGAGRALVRACVDRAVQQGASAIVICTRDMSLAAQRLYQSLGFTRVAELDWSPFPGVQLLGLRLDLVGAAVSGRPATATG